MDIRTLQKRLCDAYVPKAESEHRSALLHINIPSRFFTETGESLINTLTETGYQLTNTQFSMRLVQRIS